MGKSGFKFSLPLGRRLDTIWGFGNEKSPRLEFKGSALGGGGSVKNRLGIEPFAKVHNIGGRAP